MFCDFSEHFITACIAAFLKPRLSRTSTASISGSVIHICSCGSGAFDFYTTSCKAEAEPEKNRYELREDNRADCCSDKEKPSEKR